MNIIEFTKGGGGGALMAAEATGSTTNVDLAAAAVGLVAGGINLALATPRLTFAAALSADAEKDGDGWRWTKTMPLAGWEVSLYGEHKDGLDLEMKISGLRGEMANIKDFVWYTGHHQKGSGNWTIFAPAKTGPQISIDWRRASATDKDVTFTNVSTGEDGSGDVIKFALAGSTASMNVHDAKDKDGATVDFAVTWDTVDGHGKMTRNADAYCWDTLANGQIDIPCP